MSGEVEASKADAVVIGAAGGIGAALVAALAGGGGYATVHALSREPVACADPRIRSGLIDVTRDDTIRAAAATLTAPPGLVIVATGVLGGAARGPERALRELDHAALAHVLAVNTIGPALVLKHFAPLLPRDRPSAIAVLSARVGSISDNRAGGWYGYRASKAALNMIVRSAAIELARTRPQALCVALHPGTVDTALSRPFQARVPAERLFAPEMAARHLIAVLRGLGPGDNGRCFAWDGTEIAP